ncbi:MAG: secondary thiamine-phosphate synthase enzyme YjbQ [Thermodesulfobacteriota bacterium]|nr:secondary thiamine-phosphate synthase enzyme YjbQ [Thermodesulfobacteriota bacterium]
MRVNIKSSDQSQLIDITKDIQAVVRQADITYGLVHIFSMHTTAGVTINESADPDVRTDIIKIMNKIVPWEDNYRHMGGNAAAHAKAILVGSSELVAIENRELVLGKWQAIFFCEFDGPRERTVRLKFIK